MRNRSGGVARLKKGEACVLVEQATLGTQLSGAYKVPRSVGIHALAAQRDAQIVVYERIGLRYRKGGSIMLNSPIMVVALLRHVAHVVMGIEKVRLDGESSAERSLGAIVLAGRHIC